VCLDPRCLSIKAELVKGALDGPNGLLESGSAAKAEAVGTPSRATARRSAGLRPRVATVLIELPRDLQSIRALEFSRAAALTPCRRFAPGE
jgi:hypothetical protein